jgi:hypothetical protein
MLKNPIFVKMDFQHDLVYNTSGRNSGFGIPGSCLHS